MDDLISRQAVLNTLENVDKFLDEERTVEKYKELLTECIKVLPSAEKKGEWIKYGVPRCGEQHYKCTSCGYYINFGQWGELYTKEFKYCPNCRARMKGCE